MAAAPNPPTQHGHVIPANGVDLYYEVHGHGTPLLLLHAGSLTCDSWQPYLSAFSGRYRVITPDSRGHGRSANSAEALSYRLGRNHMAMLSRRIRSRCHSDLQPCSLR
jgi:pimeloyl-ACP methyl ester carboxylesterase